jgi:hypothetical protein
LALLIAVCAFNAFCSTISLVSLRPCVNNMNDMPAMAIVLWIVCEWFQDFCYDGASFNQLVQQTWFTYIGSTYENKFNASRRASSLLEYLLK